MLSHRLGQFATKITELVAITTMSPAGLTLLGNVSLHCLFHRTVDVVGEVLIPLLFHQPDSDQA